MPGSLAVLYIFGGVVWLLMGGDILIRGAVALSRKAGVSPLVVGLTVVAFGTSAPELVVSLRAAFAGHADLSIANVVGSNIANVLLVIGVPAIIYPMTCNQPGVKGDSAFMLGVSVLFAGLCFLGALGRFDGIVLLAALALFLYRAYRASGLDRSWDDESPEWERALGLPHTLPMIWIFVVLGAVALPLGAGLLVDGAVSIAETLGVPSAVIGLTIVAIGTSLPEFATTLVAAFKREAELAVGNIIGSNVMNLVAIMGLTALVSPQQIPIPPGFRSLSLPVMLGASVVLTWVVHRSGVVEKRVGVLLFGAYVVYTVALF